MRRRILRAIGCSVVVALAACGDGSHEGCPDDGYCPATAPVCDVDADECVACTTPEGCAHFFHDLPICRDGECVGCTPGIENPDYCPGYVCVEGASCRQCFAGSECLSGLCWDTLCLWEGEVLYVEAGASPTSDCSLEDPCGEIGRALELAEGYRRYVHVAAGEYVESVVIEPTAAVLFDEIVLWGEPGAVVAPTVDGAPAIAVQGVPLLIENLELVGAMGVGGHGLSCVDGNVAARDSEIRDGGGDGISAVGCEVAVERTSVLRNGRDGVSHEGGALTVTDSVLADNAELGVRVAACDYADISRTVVSGNRGGGLQASCHLVASNDLIVANGSGGSSIGGAELGAPFSALEFTTVADNRASTAAAASGVSCTSSMTYVIDSIVADNAADPPQLASCAVRTSLVTPGPAPTPGQNFTGDPDFISAADGNYDIGPDSDAIDRAAGTVPDDVHGDPRGPDANDVGADEYHPP